MKNIWKYLIPAVLGIIIGVLGTLYFKKPPEIKTIQDTIFIDSGIPDSVWQQKIDQDRDEYMKILIEKNHLEISNFRLANRAPEKIVVYDTIRAVGVEPDKSYYTEEDLNNMEFVSEKTFAWGVDMEPIDPDSDDYVVQSLVTAFSPLPTRYFDNEIVVRWNKYYELNVLPKFSIQLQRTEDTGKFKGLLIGALAIGGLASGNDIAAVGGLTLAGGLYIFW